MNRSATVRRAPEADRLAETMAQQTGVMREILEETIPDSDADDVTVHESGRTVCGDASNVRGPLARFPSSIELAQCPRGVTGGTWHTHVTKRELRNPSNSLPDAANVIFGDIDVSAVVGTQSMEMVISATDPGAAADAFSDAIGADVASTEDVIDAVIGQKIRDPADARQRVRRRLPGLFERRNTGFRDIDATLSKASIPASSPLSVEMHEARFYASLDAVEHHDRHTKNPVRDPERMRSHIREQKSSVKNATVAKKAGDVAFAEIVSNAVNRLIF